MRLLAATLCAATLAGCASGAPASIDRSATAQAVTPVNTLGFRPEVQATLAIPIDVTDCLVNTGTNVLRDVVDGARCVLNKVVPIVSPPAAPAYAPTSAPCFVDEQVTEMVPETRMVPRVRTVRKQLVPVQSAPCAPAPQSAPAPRSGCEPPPSPVACADGQSCGIHR